VALFGARSFGARSSCDAVGSTSVRSDLEDLHSEIPVSVRAGS
jgi:hypothetical protein